MTEMANDESMPAAGGHRISRLAPGEIASRTFGRARNGVSESEVRDFLQRIAGEIVTAREYERELEDRIAQLEEQVRLASAADPAGEIAAAQARAAEILSAAEEEAREEGRAMVNEARAVRKRMLDDAEQRRASIETELTALNSLRVELRNACEALREALGVVAPRGRATSTARTPREDADEPDQEPPVAPAVAIGAPVDTPVDSVVDDDAAEPVESDPAARIESVFARLRGAGEPESVEPESVEPAADEARVTTDEALIEDVVDEAPIEDVVVEVVVEDVDVDEIDDSEVEDAGDADVAIEDVAIEEVEPPALDDLVARRRARDQVLIPATAGLMRRAKRILQDDQNEFLDAMRRQRAKVDPAKLLPGLELQVAVWAEVLAPAVDEVYRAGRDTVAPGARTAAPKRLVSDLAESLVVPLRERLLATVAGVLDEGPYEPAAELHRALGAAVGARYREWRSQDLEALVGDLLSAAYARGAFDAAPAGARLRWIPAEVDHCPDCDDNALEATVKGQPFPTGQTYPPAHPGCRCMLALADTSAS
jgi:cell division septum initiation protein DivIVA